MNRTAIIATTLSALPVARRLAGEFPGAGVYVKGETTEFTSIASVSECVAEVFHSHDSLLFIGALGICVRTIAPHIRDNHTDPA
ncbi:MAG: precorrin-4 C(11)-methyltransferase, partial [Rikenellaceae bacterium]|nr:precorrin-4 C(11)-methyltransferase [Rikenellaceae bacterium]